MSPRKLVLITVGVAALAASVPATASAGDDVKVRDACDPVTFDAVLGDGACVRGDDRGGRVTFEALLGSAPGHGAWRFSGSPTIDEDESVRVRFDRGGEFHTFSRVTGSSFGAGCVPEINHAMGLEGPPVVDCASAFTDQRQFVGPEFRRTSVSGAELGKGTHRFICAIHPWMKTTVTVE